MACGSICASAAKLITKGAKNTSSISSACGGCPANRWENLSNAVKRLPPKKGTGPIKTNPTTVPRPSQQKVPTTKNIFKMPATTSSNIIHAPLRNSALQLGTLSSDTLPEKTEPFSHIGTWLTTLRFSFMNNETCQTLGNTDQSQKEIDSIRQKSKEDIFSLSLQNINITPYKDPRIDKYITHLCTQLDTYLKKSDVQAEDQADMIQSLQSIATSIDESELIKQLASYYQTYENKLDKVAEFRSLLDQDIQTFKIITDLKIKAQDCLNIRYSVILKNEPLDETLDDNWETIAIEIVNAHFLTEEGNINRDYFLSKSDSIDPIYKTLLESEKKCLIEQIKNECEKESELLRSRFEDLIAEDNSYENINCALDLLRYDHQNLCTKHVNFLDTR